MASAAMRSYDGLDGVGTSLDPDLKEMVACQVDDLTKYQVVQFLHRHPDVVGDAAFFAAALGFHSTDLTSTVLEELAACGILQHVAGGESDKQLYRLASEPRVRKQITRLCNLSSKVATYDELLTILANRSLERVAKRVRKRRDSLSA